MQSATYLTTSFGHGHMVAVSNGLFKESQGVAVWVFYNDHDPKIALQEGVITTPGAI